MFVDDFYNYIYLTLNMLVLKKMFVLKKMVSHFSSKDTNLSVH